MNQKRISDAINGLKALLLFGFAVLPFSMRADQAETDYDVTEANATVALPFKNYVGNSENIHPKVLYFPERWNGFRFWMAYTPYPLGLPTHENPCIAVSDNGVDWDVPTGLLNPLMPKLSNGYNSDTHLVYNPDSDTLECWWRTVDEDVMADLFYRSVTSDGVIWSSPEIAFPLGQPNFMRLAPCIDLTDEGYRMIYCNGTRLEIVYCDYESKGVWEWTTPAQINIPFGELFAWHHDHIEREDGHLEMVICCYVMGGNNNTADLYYVDYDPATDSATEPQLILKRSDDVNAIDHKAIYRSSLVRVEDEYWLYYSSIDNNSRRHMSLATGPDPLHLRGADDLINKYAAVGELRADSDAPFFALNGRELEGIGTDMLVLYDAAGVEIARSASCDGGAVRLVIPASGFYIVSDGRRSGKIVVR